MAVPPSDSLPVSSRAALLRGAFPEAPEDLPPGTLLSTESFPLPPSTVAAIERLGPLLFRFWQTADLLLRRSRKGSLPPWIAHLLDRSFSTASGPPPKLLRPSMTICGGAVALIDPGRRAMNDTIAARLQSAHASMGEPTIGGDVGIREAISRTAAVSPSSDLWMALLWAPPLRTIWERELRSSNLLFLQRHLPFTWVMDPTPLPHQAVLPRLGISSFAALAEELPGAIDLALRPASNDRTEPWQVRSELTEAAWAICVNRALSEFSESPWMLQERRPAEQAPVCGWDPIAGSLRQVEGPITLTVWMEEQGAKVAIQGVLAKIREANGSLHNQKGESREVISVLAPCRAGITA
jgi:hypothetical protein